MSPSVGAQGSPAARLSCHPGSSRDKLSLLRSTGRRGDGRPAHFVLLGGGLEALHCAGCWPACRWGRCAGSHPLKGTVGGIVAEWEAHWEKLHGIAQNVPWHLGRDQKTKPVRDGDWGGDSSNVVGYAAARIVATEGKLVWKWIPHFKPCAGGQACTGQQPSQKKWKRCSPTTSASMRRDSQPRACTIDHFQDLANFN